MPGTDAEDRTFKAAIHSRDKVEVGESGCLVERHVLSKWQIRLNHSIHGRYFYGIKKRE